MACEARLRGRIPSRHESWAWTRIRRSSPDTRWHPHARMSTCFYIRVRTKGRLDLSVQGLSSVARVNLPFSTFPGFRDFGRIAAARDFNFQPPIACAYVCRYSGFALTALRERFGRHSAKVPDASLSRWHYAFLYASRNSSLKMPA